MAQAGSCNSTRASRRNFLASSGAATLALAVGSLPALAAPSVADDATLLALEQEWLRTRAVRNEALVALCNGEAAAAALYPEPSKRLIVRPQAIGFARLVRDDELDLWERSFPPGAFSRTREDLRQYRAAVAQIDADLGLDRLAEEELGLTDVLDDIEDTILATPAAGFAGIAVKMRLLTHFRGAEDKLMQAILENVEALAGDIPQPEQAQSRSVVAENI